MEVYPSFFLVLILTCWTAQLSFCKPMQSMNSGEIDKPSNMSGAEEAETTYDGEVPLISADVEERMASGRPASSGTEGGIPDQGKCGKFCSKRTDDCEEICADDKRQGVFVKVFVGVVMPHEAPSGDSTFDLCQGEKCVEAGKVSTFGSTTERVDNPPETRIDAKKFYLAETDVTAVMIKQDWTLEKLLVAKMTKSMVGNLPQPVVILQELSKGGMKVGGKVILSPEEKRRRYGNLLDEYSS